MGSMLCALRPSKANEGFFVCSHSLSRNKTHVSWGWDGARKGWWNLTYGACDWLSPSQETKFNAPRATGVASLATSKVPGNPIAGVSNC